MLIYVSRPESIKRARNGKQSTHDSPLTDLEIELQAEADAVGPDVAFVERECWRLRKYDEIREGRRAGNARLIDIPVDFRARTNHFIQIQDGVAGDHGQVFSGLEFEINRGFRSDGKLSGHMLAAVRGSRQYSTRHRRDAVAHGDHRRE